MAREERPRSGTRRREQKQKRREERPRSGTSRREQKRKRKQKRKQRREEMQKRKRKGKVGQENNYGSGRNGKRIRGRNRNNFDEMENEFQLPTSYDNQDDENNFLDFLRERMLVELENDIVTGREEENKNW